MSFNTIEQNRTRHDLTAMEEIWVFAYGSLLFKLDFPVLEQQAAHVDGWQRRFWQGSHDHRGTPDSPGRVLTLTACTGVTCPGRALRVDASVFEHLDHREKNGYLRTLLPIKFADGRTVQGICYVADELNEAWLGPATEAVIAAHIVRSHGPSGANIDYLLKLASALRKLGIEDQHVFTLERLVLATD
ncbi:MAG: gamma-glutamylcyclotransferase [Pseudomonadales bacterium]